MEGRPLGTSILRLLVSISLYSQVAVSAQLTVSIDPKNITASRGDNVNFTCTVSGEELSDQLQFVWLYNGTSLVFTSLNNCTDVFQLNVSDEEIRNASISFSQELNILNITAPVHGGEYVCIVFNNTVGNLATAQLYMEIEFFVQPQDTVAFFDSTVSLSCSAEAFPQVEFQWQKKSSVDDSFDDIPGKVDEELVFIAANFSDGGIYRCMASNAINSSFSREATLTVNSIFPSITLKGNNFVEQGEQLKLTCTAEGGPNNEHIWMLNGEVINDRDGLFQITTVINKTSSVSMLSVSSIDAATHQGMYECNVTNMAGSDKDTLNVTVSPRGLAVTRPENVTASRRDNITFYCETEATTNSTSTEYVWMVNATNLVCPQTECADMFTTNTTDEEIANATVSYNATLQINAVTGLDGGEYTCFIFNDAGVGLSSSQLYILPEFILQPEDKEVNFTEKAILLCDADSFPYFMLQWQKFCNGAFENILEENSSMLVFQRALLSDSETYRCVVSNVINGITHLIESRNATLQVTPISPSVVLTGPHFVSQDEQVKYNCTAEGGPNNTYIWMKNGIVINDDNQHDIETIVLDTFSSSVLTVISVDVARDQGTYRCNVSNVGGTEEDSLNVTDDEELLLLFVVPVSQNEW